VAAGGGCRPRRATGASAEAKALVVFRSEVGVTSPTAAGRRFREGPRPSPRAVPRNPPSPGACRSPLDERCRLPRRMAAGAAFRCRGPGNSSRRPLPLCPHARSRSGSFPSPPTCRTLDAAADICEQRRPSRRRPIHRTDLPVCPPRPPPSRSLRRDLSRSHRQPARYARARIPQVADSKVENWW